MEPILRKNKNIGGNLNMTVYGGLNYIRGNKAPHFSITAEIKEGLRDYAGGCCHDEILRVYPDLSDLIALHLSDIDGVPLYAIENGYYWLTAAQNENSYEKGNNKDNIKIFSEYVRISRSKSENLINHIRNKTAFMIWVETQKPRWKQEADSAIKKYGLIVYGDYYKPAGGA